MTGGWNTRAVAGRVGEVDRDGPARVARYRRRCGPGGAHRAIAAAALATRGPGAVRAAERGPEGGRVSPGCAEPRRERRAGRTHRGRLVRVRLRALGLSLIHISEPT